MIKYKVSALRKKTVFEKCEFIIESESKDEARYEAADILDDCRNGEGVPGLDWEEDGEEWERGSCPYIDEMREIK